MAIFLSPRLKRLALSVGLAASGGCTMDFDHFAPLPASPQEAGPGPTADLESGTIEDVTSPPHVDASVGADSAVIDDAGQSGPSDVASDASCTESKSVLFGGHCYFPLTAKGNWMAASTSCQAAGAHLATIGTAEEQAAVAAIAPNQDRWIGLSRPVGSLEVASSYAWVTAEPASYAHWGIGEPNFTGECVRMVQGGTWADNPCATSYNALCERE